MSRRIPLFQILTEGARYQYRRWAVDMGGATRAMNLKGGKPAIFHDIKPSFLYGQTSSAEAILRGHFSYAGQKLDVGTQGDPWTVAVPSTKFATWLHGFEWLSDLAVSKDKNAAIRARSLIDKWITIYGKWNPFSWAPDVLTKRLYHWLAVWSPLLTGDNLSDEAQLRRSSVMRQLKRLRKTYKRTPPGIMRLRAAAVLAMGGARLKDKSEEFLGRGLDWLDDEIEAQILPDGGHVSRAPGQAVEALEILLTLDSLLQARGVEGSRAMSRAIDRLAPVVNFFTAADGKLVNFNGSGEGDKARLKALRKAAPETTARAFGYCPHTGYQRIEAEGTVLLVDTGKTAPRPFDDHAHLAPIAFELSTELGRLVVNCGWNDSQPQSFHRAIRGTAAHSSLTLNNQSAGQLLKEGWGTKWLGEVVAVASGHVSAKRKEQVSGTWLESSHEGYRRETGLSHRRRFYMSIDGDDLRGEDSLYVPLGGVPLSSDEIPFQIRFHFHPDVRVSLSQDQQSALLVQGGKAGWRFRTDGGPLLLEDSVYLGEGHRPVKCQQIVILGRAFCDSDGETRSNRVRWSFRKLEARK